LKITKHILLKKKSVDEKVLSNYIMKQGEKMTDKEYEIIGAMKTREFSGQYGKTFVYTINISGLNLEDGSSEPLELNQKPESPAPKAGDKIIGHIEDGKYGTRVFKRVKQSGGFQGGRSDPATRKEIIRQNSLTNAVAYCTAKANLDKTYKLLGKEIIQVATYFAKYSLGEISVVMSPEEIAKEFGYEESKEEVNLDEVDYPEEE
jgi:hypothetical protein